MAVAEASGRQRRRMAIAMAVIGTLIGLVALSMVIAHLGGRSLPFVTDDRTAFIALAVVGMVMCAFGIQTVANSTGWLSPGTFIGAALGILVLIAFVMALMNRPMFLCANYRTGFIALATVMLVKWSVSTASLLYSLITR